MRIVLDAMGSDTCPEPEIIAVDQAVKLFGDEIILVGPIEDLRHRLQAINADLNKIILVDAPDTITMQDKGMGLVLKAKRPNSKTSMAIGIDLVKNGSADAFITAGNTGGAMSTARHEHSLFSSGHDPWSRTSRSCRYLPGQEWSMCSFRSGGKPRL